MSDRPQQGGDKGKAADLHLMCGSSFRGGHHRPDEAITPAAGKCSALGIRDRPNQGQIKAFALEQIKTRVLCWLALRWVQRRILLCCHAPLKLSLLKFCYTEKKKVGRKGSWEQSHEKKHILFHEELFSGCLLTKTRWLWRTHFHV